MDASETADSALPQGELTSLLKAWREGDNTARDKLVAEVYATLRKMAAARLGGNDRTPTLQPTALAHEALLRMLGGEGDWRDRAHFLAVAALQMRSVLVDHVRARNAAKRGGGAMALELDAADLAPRADGRDEIDLLALDQALTQLEQRDPRLAKVVEMTYFGGMQRDEVAGVLGLSIPTIDRDLRFARAFLHRALGE
jgi:RNA polymerase sigma factor (TIGR02999 family)